MKKILLAQMFMITVCKMFAGPGDTAIVQAFTFGAPQDAWFNFPSAAGSYEKVLMLYTLKCNPAQSPACGEWDYLTYTYLYQHTGNEDSTLLYHPNYTANGVSPDTFNYSIIPTYTLFPHWNYSIVYDDTTAYTETQIGSETTHYNYPFTAEEPIGRTQILWKADELIAAGLVPGDISGMQFNIGDIGSMLHNLKIKIKQSAITEMNSSTYETTGFSEVFEQHIFFTASGWNSFDFITPFTWDGISNLVVEITFDNSGAGISSSATGSSTDFNSVMYASSHDKYIAFTQPQYATPVINALSSLTNQVTISFWAWGDPDHQPQNGTCFEAVDASYQRILNSHTPWSDANIYWDAGNDGYDRINKTATTSEYENNWVHWTFTKNSVSGEMKIYKNGVLWHSGSGKIKTMEDAVMLYLGKGTWGGSESYEGKMDEFAIWNVALDATTIQDYVYKDLDDAHPFHDNLVLYYHFNDADGIYQADYSASNASLALMGATTHLLKAESQFRNLQFVNIRPDVKFEQGLFSSHADSVLVIDTVYNTPVTLITFDPADPTTGIDTILVYASDYYNYIYNASGAVIDSNYIASTNTLYNTEYAYYSDPFEIINRFELARYITPYGIGLDLGEGFTWTFDVTDYLPLLHDSVHLNAGNWQELLDVKFLFIEGTPSRKPVSVTNLYTGSYGYGSTPSYDDQTVPLTIHIPEDAENTRIKLRITGHGNGTGGCSEFCNKEHFMKVNGIERWSKDVWRNNCDLNPLYPQGGTWIFDRANWCPGAEVETYDFELTPFVSPGSDVTLDYGAEAYTNSNASQYPYYVTEVQMITYDSPNFTHDAAVEEILAPNNNQMWGRKNPICNNPVIIIKNNGTETLTSLKIEFGITGFEKAYYNWTGSLDYLSSEEIILPDFPWTDAATGFEVTVSDPNGTTDAYSLNDHKESKITVPPQYPSDFIIEFKTNAKPAENDLYLYDGAGNEIFSRTSGTSANTTYRDTMHLSDGCYELVLEDSGEDGLSFWYYPLDGNGSLKLKNTDVPTYFKTFNPDFGSLIDQQFTVGTYVETNDLIDLQAAMSIYPNPATNVLYVNLNSATKSSVQLQVIDVHGRVVYNKGISDSGNGVCSIDCSNLVSGVYILSAEFHGKKQTKIFVINK